MLIDKCIRNFCGCCGSSSVSVCVCVCLCVCLYLKLSVSDCCANVSSSCVMSVLLRFILMCLSRSVLFLISSHSGSNALSDLLFGLRISMVLILSGM